MSAVPKIIIGAGRHALETFHLVEDMGLAQDILGFAVDAPAEGQRFAGLPVFPIAELLSSDAAQKPEVIIAIGAVEVNKRLAAAFRQAGYAFFNAIDPKVPLQRQAVIGTGVTIAQGTILTCNVSVGDHAIVNVGCTISHDCVIGAHVNISPGCHLAGNVIIEDDVFVGTGAIFIPKVRVGRGSVIAAGACVTRDVPPGCMVAGVPAVVKKNPA